MIDVPASGSAVLLCLSGSPGDVLRALEAHGIWVTTSHDPDDALARLNRLQPDLLLLHVDGRRPEDWATCQDLAGRIAQPVLVVAEDPAVETRLAALASGADDVLTRPFHPLELVGRARALARRAARTDPPTVLRHHELVVDLDTHQATLGGRPVPLTPIEFRLIATLLGAPQRTFTRDELLARLHRFDDTLPTDRSIDWHVADLRRKLGDCAEQPRYVETVRGVGYRLAAREQPPAADRASRRDEPGGRAGRPAGDGRHLAPTSNPGPAAPATLVTRWETTMRTFDAFELEREDGTLWVRLNRPERLNALTFEVYGQLTDLMGDLREEPDVRVVVITGQPPAFCSGGDVHDIIGQLFERDMRGVLEFTRLTGRLVERMRTLDKPIIAAINGIAAGAGAVIALASDLRLLARSARFAFLFTRVGLTGADMGAAYLLPRVVGLGRATELLLLGDTIDAETAERYGLAYRVVDDDQLEAATRQLAARLASGPALALGMTKVMLTNEASMDLHSAIEAEAQAQALLLMGRDHREFYEAFREKRAPVWTGR